MTMVIDSTKKIASVKKGFVCLDPHTGSKIRAHYEGTLSPEEERELWDHICFCFSCQEKVARIEDRMRWVASAITGQAGDPGEQILSATVLRDDEFKAAADEGGRPAGFCNDCPVTEGD